MDRRLQSRACRRCGPGFVALAGLLAMTLLGRAGAEDDSLAGKPVVAKNADGHLEVFRVEPDGELRHRWQKESNGDWSSWSSLGGAFFPGIAAATNAEGELEVFAVERRSGALWHIRQRSPDNPNWSGWTSLGGELRPPVAVGQDADGRLEVFAVDARSNRVKRLWQTAQSGWSAWGDLGGNVMPGVVAARNRDGRLELFGIDAGNKTLVHCWQQCPNGMTDWSEWSSLGGTVQPGFAVGQNLLGCLEVFAVGSGGSAVRRICQASASDSLHWTPWLDFGGNVKTGLAVGQSADGRLEVMAVNAEDGMLLHRWEVLADGSDLWSSVWTPMGKQAQPYPAVGQNEDGNLEVFAQDVEHGAILNHRRQISRASDWLDWSSLDRSAFEYSSRTWQVDEGLPHNMVQAIAQTRDGYLWVGTGAGLARFDGISFTTFDARNTPAIKNVSITALCADREGALWIGTDGGGLVCLKDGIFSHYGQTNGLAGDVLRVIYQSRDGSLWIGTTTGMSRYRNGQFTNYSKREGLLSDIVRSLHEDRAGNLWIATGEGLNRLNGTIMDSFAMPNGLPNDSVRCICQDSGGRIWIGSNNGMLWYSAYWGNFYAYNTRYGLSDTFVSAICEDREGNLWVGTYSGLNRFREGRFFNQLNNEGAPFDRVNALFEDREGNLWVGSKEGLVRLTPKRFSTYAKREGLTHNNVMSVLEDRAGSLWIGTWGGGLNQLKDERVTAYIGTNGFSQALVLSLCEGRDGSLWVGADFDGGLTRLKDGQFTHYTSKDGLTNAALKVLHEDRSGNLWIGTSQGLACFKGGKFAQYTARDNLAGDAIKALCEDHAGRLWIGTEGGLSCWQDGRFTSLTTRDGLSDNTVTALYEDKEQNLWIGTGSGGLNRYREGRFAAYTTRQGLFSDEIFEILEDDQGWLWMSCSRGVFRVRKQDLNELDQGKAQVVASVVYGKTDGLESPQCNGTAKPAGWKTRDGRLWFPTSKGLIAVDPGTAKINHVPPPVYIEQLIADKRPVRSPQSTVHSPQSTVHSPQSTVHGLRTTDYGPGFNLGDGPLIIPPGRGELEFRYTALNFQAPEATRFKYKLEGVNSEWIDAGTRRTAYYNNVYPDTYRFRVIACNKDGVWNEAGATLVIVLRPHIWQTWWLRGALALAVIGLASATARYLTRKRMQRKLELLEQRHAIEKERGRIAKDIHDDLGSSLTRIMMLGERAEEDLAKREDVANHVTKIVVTARQTVQALDEIVWAVNPENDTLEGLIEYISHYADEFFENTDVSCRLEMPVDLPAFALPAEVRHDLFLVVKEAFNNILKHSQASEVRVQVSAAAPMVEMVIEDNGCGFAPGEIAPGRKGNGLGNMRKRIEGLGGKLAIITAPGQGTRLMITARLNWKGGVVE